MNKGMTLIEVIIAMALLSIILIVMFTVFGTSILGIINFGHDTEAVFDDVKDLEDAISTDNPTGSAAVTVGSETSMIFTFENSVGTTFNVAIDGKLIETNNRQLQYFWTEE
jgi:prepilin-type N-terminal cleavage/methylation domain-containing protein